ncbi:PREDICTED: putative upstream-binding factor 1-like protein 1-like, partial [Elephantulus edwardii]|uniref:putative upstream-binding factor 1-like protein 1-like n=1 Tax=Elephantulus edwardii TaxID=28737 RepID=UPI0003F0648A
MATRSLSGSSQLQRKLSNFPKKPLTAYFRFYKENYREYMLKNPKLSKAGLTKLLAKQYRELPEEMKEKYAQDFEKEKEEFKRQMAQFKRDHPHLIFQKNSKRPVVQKRHQEEARKHSPGNLKNMKSSKETYGFSKETNLHREPKKPPMNGYHKFHEDIWSSKQLQHLNPKGRMVEISRMWHQTPKSLKDHFQEQAEHMVKQYRVDLDRWLNTLSPTEYTAYRKRTYGKCLKMSMKGGPSPQIRLPSQSPPGRSLQERPGEMKLEVAGTDSSVTHPLQSFSVPAKKEDVEKLTSSDSSESNTESESESE